MKKVIVVFLKKYRGILSLVVCRFTVCIGQYQSVTSGLCWLISEDSKITQNFPESYFQYFISKDVNQCTDRVILCCKVSFWAFKASFNSYHHFGACTVEITQDQFNSYCYLPLNCYLHLKENTQQALMFQGKEPEFSELCVRNGGSH